MTRFGERLWALRSYVPGTVEHEEYSTVMAWLEGALAALRLVIPLAPDFPPVGRNPRVMVLAIDTMLEALEGAELVLSLEEPQRVIV